MKCLVFFLAQKHSQTQVWTQVRIWSAEEAAHTQKFKLFFIQVPQPSIDFPKYFSQPLQHGCEHLGMTVITALIPTSVKLCRAFVFWFFFFARGVFAS